MRSKKLFKKLVLKKETIAALENSETGAVRGGTCTSRWTCFPCSDNEPGCNPVTYDPTEYPHVCCH